MNNNTTLALSLALMSLLTSFACASEPQAKPSPGEAELAMRCLICHGDGQVGQQRLAPPMVMVKMRYMQPTEEAFVKRIADWVKKPDAEKSKFPGAIHRFKLMPTFVIPEEEVKLIAQYIYKTEFKFPGNCGAGHQHGGKGQQGAAGCDETDCPEAKSGKGGKSGGGGKNPADCGGRGGDQGGC
jgi:mono/diheme cytochrome c family protein